MTTESSYEVSIVQPGTFKIKGSSNVNNFSLEYKKPVIGKKLVSFGDDINNRISLKGDTQISLDINGFSSSQSFILRDFKKMIKSDNYPTIDINLARFIKSDNPNKIYAMAIISIANTKRLEIMPVVINKTNEDTYNFKSSYKISLKNYNLDPPQKMMGMIAVNDDVSIDLTLTVRFKKI